MDESSVQHLATVLTHLNDATIDWAAVATARGIARKDNAATSFKTMMKKHGIEYSNNKFTLLDPDAAAAATKTNGAKAKAATTPRKRKPKVTKDNDETTKDESASPKKKRKAKKDETVEDDDEEDD